MKASRMTIPVVTPDYYSTPYDQTEEYETSTCPKDEETIVIPASGTLGHCDITCDIT